MKHFKRLKIDFGTPTYKYTWVSNTPCVTFDNTVGVSTDGYIETNITVLNENCYANNLSVTLNVIDANGCKASLIVYLENPCTTYDVPTISYNGNLFWTVFPNGGTAPYTYLWEYPFDIFSDGSVTTTDTLELTLISVPDFNAIYPITVTVTDNNGCVRKATYNYNFCHPIAQPITVVDFCNLVPSVSCGTGTSKAIINFADNIIGCSNTYINWNTLSVKPPINCPGFTVLSNINGIVTICMDLYLIIPFLNNGVLPLTWTVKDSNNMSSTVGTVDVVISDCTQGYNVCIQTLPSTYEVECTPTFPYVLTNNINNNVIGNNIDWTTFTFIASGTQTLTNSTTLDLGYGVVTLDINHNIVITLASIPSGITSEVIKWKVCNTNGCCSQTTSDVIILQCNDAPIANNDSYCVECGVPTSLPVTSNDTGNISLGSYIVITQNPTHGTATINGLAINYIANNNYFGSDTIKYIVVDDNGLSSNEATVDITVSCPGNPSNTIIC